MPQYHLILFQMTLMLLLLQASGGDVIIGDVGAADLLLVLPHLHRIPHQMHHHHHPSNTNLILKL